MSRRRVSLPTFSHPLPEPLVERIAHRFRVIGEPMRIRILEQLRDGEASVQEITEATGVSQQNVSKHLGVMFTAGIVGRRKQGTFTYYRIVDQSVFDLCEQVCASLAREVAALNEAIGGVRS